jgi:hypothetical protein
MTVYNTTDLAVAIMGEEAIETNKKSATRTLRKFLRDDMGDGKAVVGKGSRYALDLKAAELKAMKKRFAAWEVAQEEAKEARKAALEAIKKPVAPVIEVPAEEAPDAPIEEDEALGIDGIEDPSDDDFEAMLAEAISEDA